MSHHGIQLIEKMVKAMNDKDFKTLESLYDPNGSYHSTGDLADADRSAYVGVLREYMNAFSDLIITLDDVFASGDKVAYRVTGRGTHTDELFGVPPTKKKAEYISVNMARISGDKIVEEWYYGNDLDFWQQLGTAPPASVTTRR